MDTLKIGNIYNWIRDNKELFELYEEVYIFGSLLRNPEEANDIDLLLLYDTFFDEMLANVGTIKRLIECRFGRPVDLTILSFKEESECQFIKRLGKFCDRVL